MNLTADFTGARVLVVGDVMLDRYHCGISTRISPEAPVPVVKVDELQEHAGGAANVAVNLASLGSRAYVLGLTGTGDNARRLRELLDAAGVEHRLIGVEGERTTVKARVVSHNQQLLRFDSETNFNGQANKELHAAMSELMGEVDTVIFSDYAKGALSDIEQLIAIARDNNKTIFVDPKSDNFERYRGATVLTPNYNEFVAVVGACKNDDEMINKARDLRAKLDLHSLVITLGERGMVMVGEDKEALSFPAEAHEVYDVTGAGDTVVAVMAAAHASGLSLANAVYYANYAAGIVVGKAGTAAVTPAEMILRANAGSDGVCNKSELLEKIKQVRSHGERVVMTNGCFDILHAGHIAYLNEAAQYGERLVVAVNDDASVAKLKGKGRPINSLEQRMKVLSSLRMVDWVVPFSEDTPAALIAEVSPDVLVKGGDYKKNEIAGAEHVEANGGKVIVTGFVDGYSTSETIRRVRDLKL